MIITFVERELRIDGVAYDLAHPIDDAFVHDDVVIVLFDPDSRFRRFGQFHNLIAIDRVGQLRWEAELPTSTTGDRYYKLASRDPIVAYSTQSFDCVIDAQTGRIVTKTFTK